MAKLGIALRRYNQLLQQLPPCDKDIEKYRGYWDLLQALHSCLCDYPLDLENLRKSAEVLDEIIINTKVGEEINYAALVLQWGVNPVNQ